MNKSLLVAAMAFLAAPLRAATNDRKASRPTQLVLDFAPATSVLAQDPALSLQTQELSVDPVRQAFNTGIAEDYERALIDSEQSPPLDDDAQQRLVVEAATRRDADRLWPEIRRSPAAPGAAPGKRPRKTMIDYEAFGKRVDAVLNYLSIDQVFDGTQTKRAILSDSGVTHLKGQGKTRIPIGLA